MVSRVRVKPFFFSVNLLFTSVFLVIVVVVVVNWSGDASNRLSLAKRPLCHQTCSDRSFHATLFCHEFAFLFVACGSMSNLHSDDGHRRQVLLLLIVLDLSLLY